MEKIKIRKVSKSILVFLVIPFILSGCSRNADCSIEHEHIHKYEGTNHRGKIVNYFNSESETITQHYTDYSYYLFEYKRQDENISINMEDEKIYELFRKNNRPFIGVDNWDFLYTLMANKPDYLEYQYRYSKKSTTKLGWTKNINARYEFTGKVRVCHYRFCGHRIVERDGKFYDERSPFVDDIREIIYSYPYFQIDCYDTFYKEYTIDKKRLKNIKLEDLDDWPKPDLENKELFKIKK